MKDRQSNFASKIDIIRLDPNKAGPVRFCVSEI